MGNAKGKHGSRFKLQDISYRDMSYQDISCHDHDDKIQGVAVI